MAASDYRQYPILLLHLSGRPQMDSCRRFWPEGIDIQSTLRAITLFASR